MSKLPLVVVEWDDAWADSTEPVMLNEVGAEHKPMPIVTIGWLLRDDDAGVSIAPEYYKHADTYRGRTFIPRGMVRTVTTFRLTKPKRAKDAE